MKCGKKFPAIKKKGVITTPAHICDGEIKCVDAYLETQKDYCCCGTDDYCDHYFSKLVITYQCTKCNSKDGPIDSVYDLVDVINHYISCME